MKLKHWLPVALVAGVSLAASAAAAAENNSMDRIVDLYRNGAENWNGPLLTVARGLFGLLAICEFSWAMIRHVMKGADVAELMGEIVNQVMFIGFFMFLMLNSTQLAHAIIDSFRQAGDMASSAGGGSAGVRPSDIFEAGLNIATTTMKAALDTGMTGIGQSVGLMVAAIFTLVAFALICAFMIIALVESYVISSAGVLMMGFGGSRMTKDYAVKTMTYAVSVGAKLFVMQLIVGLGEGVMKTMAAGITPGVMIPPEDIFTMLGFAIVLLCLTKTIPEQVQGLINGVSANSSGNILASAVAGAVGGAMGQALGAGNAVAQSFRLASQQLGGESGGGGAGGAGEGGGGDKGGGKLGAVGRALGGAAKLSGQAGANLLGAAASDFGGRLAGHTKGSMGGRMGEALAKQNRELKREGAAPPKPGAEGGGQKTGAAGAAGAAAGGAAEAAGSIRPAGDEAAEAANTTNETTVSGAEGGEQAASGAGEGGDQAQAGSAEQAASGSDSGGETVQGAQEHGGANNQTDAAGDSPDGQPDAEGGTISGANTTGEPDDQDTDDDQKRD